jgi:hypothetical protein
VQGACAANVVFSSLPSYSVRGVEINRGVLIVEPASRFTVCTNSTLVLRAEQAASVRVGSVLLGALNGFDPVASEAPVSPCELLTRVVTGITVNAGVAVLTTEPATLLDIVLSGNYNATTDLPAPDPIDTTELIDPDLQPRSGGQRMLQADQSEALSPGEGSSQSHVRPLQAQIAQAGEEGKVKLSLPISDKASAITEARFSFQPRFGFSVSAGVGYIVEDGAGIAASRLKSFAVGLRIEAAAGFVMKASATAGFEYKVNLTDNIFQKVPAEQAFFPCVPGVPAPIW